MPCSMLVMKIIKAAHSKREMCDMPLYFNYRSGFSVSAAREVCWPDLGICWSAVRWGHPLIYPDPTSAGRWEGHLENINPYRMLLVSFIMSFQASLVATCHCECLLCINNLKRILISTTCSYTWKHAVLAQHLQSWLTLCDVLHHVSRGFIG